MVIRPRASSVAHAQEARSDWIDVLSVELVEVATVVDEDSALERLFGIWVVADAVVGEVVKDFEGEEIAGDGDVGFPGKYGAVNDFDLSGVAPRGR